MKNYLILTSLLLTSYLGAIEGDIPPLGDHYLKLGMENFYVRGRERSYPTTTGIDAFYSGVTGSYEFLEPNNIYCGLVGSYCLGSIETFEKRIYPARLYYIKRRLGAVYKNVEGRLGYNFEASDELNLSVYLGLGRNYKRGRTEDAFPKERTSVTCWYLTTGMRSEYALSDSVKVGVNFRRFYAMTSELSAQSHVEYFAPLNYGHEISFPWEVQFRGTSEKFVLRFEPYIRKENATTNELTFGSTLQMSCDF